MSIAQSIQVSEVSGVTFLDIDNAFATARVSLFGGHILSYIPKQDGQERLWLSPHAVLSGEKPIRGGIPVCWPWFSDDHGREKGQLPAHGYLRSQVWKIQHSEDTDSGTLLVLRPTFTRGNGFEYDCNVSLTIEVAETLTVTLKTTNSGLVPFTFNTALHSYFQVDDIQHVTLTGIEGEYKDKLENWAVKTTPQPYKISGETDRIHQHATPEVVISEKDLARTRVVSSGHDSMVIWNPWLGAASIADMDAFGYKHMVCVETACTDGVTLAPQDSHSLVQTIC
ncbi:D-hexose-6-phosphate mutarotase [Salinimonas lutimaris]|uniref:D-hexose-6-phosphate mutarotase n=1 Tax=Salinimonas lutimaris TaxID=914153 RepID=UPI0010C07B68|nr:D-hexose-6-phosphate mutarotase [Salinimonas lutimaris]